VTAPRTVGLIAGREIRQRLRSKLFVWTTVLLALLFTGAAFLPTIVGALDRGGPADEPGALRIAVVGPLAPEQEAALVAAVGAIELEPVTDTPAAAELVDDGDVALAIIDGDRLLAPQPTGVFTAGAGAVDRAAEALALVEVLDAAGAADAADDVIAVQPLPVELIGDQDPVLQAARFVVANVGVVFLFAILMFYASMIVNGIIEEKGSRVVEVLVEAVPVRQLMAGKLLGLGVIALGQMLALFGPPAAVLLIANRDVIPPGLGGLITMLFVWFVLGYAFYSLLCAGLGALVSRPEEAQAVLTPATMLALTGYFVGFAAIQAPDATFAVVAGWLPPSAPFVMLVRQAVGTPTAFEVAGSLVLLGLAIVLVARLSARIYEGGILRVGARVRIGEAFRSPTA
jgi:ABC-2 type transport system permease protein